MNLKRIARKIRKKGKASWEINLFSMREGSINDLLLSTEDAVNDIVECFIFPVPLEMCAVVEGEKHLNE